VAASAEFKKIQDQIKKSEKRKEELAISEILSDKDKNEDEENDENSKANANKSYAQIKAERQEKYLKRADIIEAVNVAVDLAILQSGADLQLVRKEVDNTLPNQVKETDKN
jgi:hypothetical protein